MCPDRTVTVLKKVCVLLRNGDSARMLSPRVWRDYVLELLSIAKWLVLHEHRYQPITHGFSLLDQNAINGLLREIASGGWMEGFQIPARLVSSWYRSIYGTECPADLLEQPYSLPEAIRLKMAEWLADEGYGYQVIAGVHRRQWKLSRSKLAKQVNATVSLLGCSLKFSVFCRQFEPHFSRSALLLPAVQRTEYPDHATKVPKEILRETTCVTSFQSTASMLRYLLRVHRHLPNDLPDPQCLSVKQSSDLARTQARAKGHTRFIPVDVGLTYLNEAMRWVHCYGEALVDYYLTVLARVELTPGRTRKAQSHRATLNAAFAGVDESRFIVRRQEGEASLARVLGISAFTRDVAEASDYEAFRKTPTLAEAMDILIGACAICIGLLKPSRESELVYLKRDCLIQGHDGYYLRFELGKSNVGEAYQLRDKPIPSVTAHAIQLLQRLGAALAVSFAESRRCKDNLFYLPSASGMEPLTPAPNLLNSSLDRFCDYVGLPPDSLGRRWYVRIHEMRKWFLLLLFWAGRYDVLDAVRWIAGHVRAEDTYAYIEHEFPGEELPGIEAQYSIDRLRHLDQVKRISETSAAVGEGPGLDALYDRVCQHFEVSSLVMVPEPQWTDYVVSLREQNGFALHPHTVCAITGDDAVALTVAFVLAKEPA